MKVALVLTGHMRCWQDVFPNFKEHFIDRWEQHILRTGESYDMVIRVRPDVIYKQPLPEFDPNIFYTSANANHLGQGTGDTIQVGSMKNIIKYSKIGMYLEEIYEKTDILCPHIVSQYYIEKILQLPWDGTTAFPHSNTRIEGWEFR